MASFTEGNEYQGLKGHQIPYFTPKQPIAAGSAVLDPEKGITQETVSPVFRPLTVRGVKFQNRIFVSPVAMYSCEDGLLTDFHLLHYGQFALRGAPLTTIEATAVLRSGLNNTRDSGLWSDEQTAPLKRIVNLIHSQSQKVGIQLQHAGREVPIPESGNEDLILPHEMNDEAIWGVVNAFGAAAKRAVSAGIDVIAIHGAHGSLIHSFISPTCNRRTDKWGGSFDNRIRFPVEVVRAIRRTIPKEMPLIWKLSVADWLPPSQGWEMEDTLRFAPIIAFEGVDMLDVSGGETHQRPNVKSHPQDQADFAKAVKSLNISGLYIGAVGGIQNGAAVANKADFCSVARQFLRDPNFVQSVAVATNTKVAWPEQYRRAPYADY